MFDIWSDMFVMGIGRCQIEILRVGKVIVPVESFTPKVDLISIRRDQSRIEIQFLPQAQSNTTGKEYFPFRNTRVSAIGPYRYRRSFHRRTTKCFSNETAV